MTETRDLFERARGGKADDLNAFYERCARTLLLRKLEELTFPEIASRTGKSEDACRMASSRAMAALTVNLAGD